MSLSVEKALRKAQSHIKAGELAEAEEFYKQVLSKFPKNKKAIQGYQKLKAGITLNGLASSEPSQEQIQELINLYNQGQFVKALDKAKPLIGLFPHAIHLHNIQGACHAALQRYDAAIDSYKQAIKIKPDYAEAYSNMGNALKDKGELDAAIDNYKQAIKIKPDYAEAYSNMGNVLKEKGELNAAIDSYKQAIKIKPDYVKAYYNMGVVLKSKGELDASIDSYKQAIKIKPDYAEAYYNMGNVLKEKGELNAAIDSYKQAIKIKPDYAEAYSNMGNVLKEKGELNAAIDSYKQAIKIKPDYAEAYSNMGVALKEKGELDAAIDSYEQAIKVKPDYAEAYSNMGVVLKDKGELDASIDSHKQAIKIKPYFAEAHSNLGIALNDKGELDAAIDSYKQAIKIKPDYAEAHRHLSTVKKYNFADEQITQMKFLYADQKLENDRKCHLCFALAKASEDLGDFQEAFDYLKEGNALRKKGLSYDIKKDQTIFANLKKSDLSIPQNTVVSIKKPSDVTPIFILGMPRSGTTLVEQIVSSHSKVTGAGELRFVQQFGLKMAFGTQEINERNLLNFREQYLNSLIQLGEGNLYITDKMPENFQFIGLICRAFPETKIIHVKRDPAATCWSNFKHYFPTSGLGSGLID